MDAGINGVDPWGPTDVSEGAHWIWTAGGGDDAKVCCTYTSKHQHLNCPAARAKYVKDYPDAQLGNQYANSHYQATGAAEGRIWHNELCNEDGTDVDMDGDDTVGQVHMCGDDAYTLYINEKEVGQGDDYTKVQAHTFTASCDTPTVYAIDGTDTGGIASLMLDVNHCGEAILSSTAWKCNQFDDGNPLPKDWKSVGFDDSAWPSAGDAGDNGVQPWGRRLDISDEAHWMWTQDPNGHDHVYCRYVSQHKPLNCPAASARYWADYRDVASYDGGYEQSLGYDGFDHYMHYGRGEGRTWHSELCEEDGTNKESFCEVKHTSSAYEYDFLQAPLGAAKSVTFSSPPISLSHLS